MEKETQKKTQRETRWCKQCSTENGYDCYTVFALIEGIGKWICTHCFQIEGESIMPGNEFDERARLIEQILDKISPIPADALVDVRESIDIERQTLAMRAGWGSMSIEELRRTAQPSSSDNDDRSPYIFSVVIDGEKIVESRPLNNDEAKRLAEVLRLPFPAWFASNAQNKVGIHLDSTR